MVGIIEKQSNGRFFAHLAIPRQFRIGPVRIGILVAGAVLAAGQINLVPGVALMTKLYAGAYITHGITAAAPGTGVGVAAVDQAAVVQACLIGRQFKGDFARFVNLEAAKLPIEHIRLRVYRLIFPRIVAVGAGNHVHATIKFRGWIDRQPEGDDLLRRQHRAVRIGALPVEKVFVPGYALAVAAGLADEMAGKQGDVRPEEWLDKIENCPGKKPVEKSWIGKVGNIHRFGPHLRRQATELALKVFLQRVEFGWTQNVPFILQVTFAPIEVRLRLSQPRLGEGIVPGAGAIRRRGRRVVHHDLSFRFVDMPFHHHEHNRSSKRRNLPLP